MHNQAFLAARSQWIAPQIVDHCHYNGDMPIVIFYRTKQLLSNYSLACQYYIDDTDPTLLMHIPFWSDKCLVQGTFGILFTKPKVPFDQIQGLYSFRGNFLEMTHPVRSKFKQNSLLNVGKHCKTSHNIYIAFPGVTVWSLV